MTEQADVADRLRTWLTALRSSSAEFAERAKPPTAPSCRPIAASGAEEGPQLVYTPDELVLLDETPPGVRVAVAMIKTAFEDAGGATVVDIRPRNARLT